MSARSSRTKRGHWRCCARGCSRWSCAGSRKKWARCGGGRWARVNAAARFARTTSARTASPTTASGSPCTRWIECCKASSTHSSTPSPKPSPRTAKLPPRPTDPSGTTPRRADQALAAAVERLTPVASESARLEAELLLGHSTGWSRAQVLAHPEWELSADQQAQFETLVERRSHAEPIAYLLGEREVYGLVFKVDRRALIPRPETELLVELGQAAVARFRAQGIEPRVLELGTGSGAVAISLARA